jgi:acyl-coenzyme A synthetase/AMP-(fatty) acid ligase/acyl carrier protein
MTSRMPVGRAVPDRQLSIVGEDGNLLANGEIGEMIVASPYLALGYWRDPERTAHFFSVDPNDPETRIFRTGDLGFRRADGLYEFVGRKDHQIKLRGHRIEPEEIEGVLRSIPGVRDAAIVVRKSGSGLPQSLIGYVEVSDGASLTSRVLIAKLAGRLPAYMVPSGMNVVHELPRLANFKVDRVRLACADNEGIARAKEGVTDPLIQEIAATFCSVLGVSWAEPEDNIGSLGGDSLGAVRIALELENRFQIAIPPDVFEGTPTIRHLASWIATERELSRKLSD